MPTVYTAGIANGRTFAEFAMDCARAFGAFGACVTLRDADGGGEAIPEQFNPDHHAKEAAEAARGDLAILLALTPAETEEAAAAYFERIERERLERLDAMLKLRASYEAIKAQVVAWNPPTPEHLGLRRFMLEQIDTAIRYDCESSRDYKPTPKLTPAEWFTAEREALVKRIEQYDSAYAKSVERAAASTKWVRELRASL